MIGEVRLCARCLSIQGHRHIPVAANFPLMAAFNVRLAAAFEPKFTVKPQLQSPARLTFPNPISTLLLTEIMASRGLTNTALFICDIQERFKGIIHEYPHVIKHPQITPFSSLTKQDCRQNAQSIENPQNPSLCNRTKRALSISIFLSVLTLVAKGPRPHCL